MALLLGLDIGTTSTKVCAYDPDAGQTVAVVTRPTPVVNIQPGWCQHEPEDLWAAVATCLQEVAAHPAVQSAGLAGLGVSSFNEAGLPLDQHMQPLFPIIAWYDRRTQPYVSWWLERLEPEELHAVTGQRSSPSFGVNKWLWLRDNAPEITARARYWLSTPDYILYRLTGQVATERSIASRTLLMDQTSLDWSDQMLALASMRREMLPPILPGGSRVGTLTARAAAATGLPAGLPCSLGGHDHLCAGFAAGLHRPGLVVDSTGTAQALVFAVPQFVTGPRLARQGYACYAHVVDGLYAITSGLRSAGGAIAWMAGLLVPGSENGSYALLEQEARQGIGRTAGPVFLPHLLGSGTPEADPESRGVLAGALPAHTRGDLFRAVLEGLAFSMRKSLEEMEKVAGQAAQEAVLLGGVTRLNLLSQLKADVLNKPMRAPGLGEAAATGAALLGGLGSGVFATYAEAAQSVKVDSQVFRPDPTRAAWYDEVYERVYLPLYHAVKDVNHAIGEIDQS